MKTPREILLERHQAAEDRLDAVRQRALADLAQSPAPERNLLGVAASWRDFVLSLRWHLAGMSAIWLAVVLLNIDHSPGPAADIAKDKIPSPRQLLMALRENRRQLLEVIDPPVIEPASIPPRRSEVQSPAVIV